MKRENLYYVLFEQQKEWEEEKEYVARELTGTILSLFRLKLPIIITGIRRSGKSTLLKLLKKELKLGNKASLYINFNDERLIDFSVDDFQKILEFLDEERYQKNGFLFIDEIQEVAHWEKWIDRIKEKHPLIITGSNSKLLSKEISTTLTGRSINTSLYPFSFREFLTARKIEWRPFRKDLSLQARIRKEFLEYCTKGGIPKAIIENEPRLLSEIYENILYRDIVKRFHPNLEKSVKETSLFLLSNISKPISLRSLSEITGITNLLTMKTLLNSFENAFLFSFVSKFDFSVKKQIQNPRKVYCTDFGFVTEVGFRFSEDRGRVIENLVLIELKRRNKHVYYFSGKNECDFVLREGINIKEAIQVCYELTPDNKVREVNGLLEAMENFGLKEGLILTNDHKEEIVQNKKKIHIVPIWKWLLSV